MTDHLTDEWERHFHHLVADLHAKTQVGQLADEIVMLQLTKGKDMLLADQEAEKNGGKAAIKLRDQTRFLEVAHRIAKDSRSDIQRRVLPAAPAETVGQPIHQNPSLSTTLANLNLPEKTKAGMAQAQLEAMPLAQAILFYDSIIQEPKLGREFAAMIDWYPPLELAEGDVEEVE